MVLRIRDFLSRSAFVMCLGSTGLAACGSPGTDPAVTGAIEAHLKRANTALTEEKFDKAFAALEAAGALDPRSPLIQRSVQEALVRRAAAVPTTITDDNSPRISYAIEVLADVPALAPMRLTAEAHLALARGEAETGLAKLEEAIKAAADYPHAYLAKAQLLRSRGQKLEALSAFEAAIKAAPNSVTALNNTGVAYLEYERAEDALKLFEQATKLLDNASTRLNAADANLALKRKTEAEEHLKRAVILAPKSALPLRRLGALLKDQQKLDEAAAVLSRALALENDAWTAFNLGVIQQERKLHNEAIPLLARAMQLDATAFAPPYHIAVSLQALGDSAGADRMLERYIQLSANVPSEGERRKQVLARFRGNAPAPAPAPTESAPEPPAAATPQPAPQPTQP
jgi:tetratricopeptide (TPR) repeat protein